MGSGSRGQPSGHRGTDGEKRGLIFTSDFCKLVYHVTSCPLPENLPWPPPDPSRHFVCTVLYFSVPVCYHPCWVLFLKYGSGQTIPAHTRFSWTRPTTLLTRFHHRRTCCRGGAPKVKAFSSPLGLVERPGLKKVRRRRKHQEIYAQKEHELTGGPLAAL